MKLVRLAISIALLTALYAAFITNANAQPVVFRDIDASFWGYEAIQWGVAQNIITGYEDGTFRPDQGVTEEEFITLLVRAYGITTSHKNNIHWSEPYYQVAFDHNLPMTYIRSMALNREAVAEIIVAARGVNFIGDDAIEYMLNKGLAKGKFSATIEGYGGKDTLTRAEAVVFLKNVIEKTEDRQMRVKPLHPSPRFLLDYSDELQITNPKMIESLEQTVQYFSESLQQFGYDSSNNISFEDFILNGTLDNINDSSRVFDAAPALASSQFLYNFSILTSTETGEVDKVSVSISENGKLKEIIQSAIIAFIQDVDVGKQFYDKHQLSKLIDQKHNNHNSGIITVEDDQYQATYYYINNSAYKMNDEKAKAPTVHIFTISKI